MKVLHAFNQHRGGGGATNVARKTIELERRAGMDVEVFARDSADIPATLMGKLRTAGSAIYARSAVRAFDDLLQSFSPDVVHVHEVFPLVSPWILPRCTRRGVPVVMTCVDYRLTCPVFTHLCGGEICTRCSGGREYWAVLKNCRGSIAESATMAAYNMMSRKLRLFSNHVSHYIAPSEFTRQWLIANGGIDPAQITTISPAVVAPASPADPLAGRYIGYAGRLAREKGVETLLSAARMTGLPVRLARNERSLVSLAMPADADVVVTHGREDLDAFYCGARMLVLPSVWFETFALVGAEAMMHGIPVVASRIGAMQCLIDDEVDGLLFEPGNAGDLAEKITRLWRDDELCRRLGLAAREKALRLWSEQRHVSRLASLYAQVGVQPDGAASPEKIPAARGAYG